MATTIESLELEIKSNSSSATRGLNALIQSLNKLKSATAGGAGLSSVSSQLTSITGKLSNASKNMNKFGNSLSSVGKNALTGSTSLLRFGAALLVIRKTYKILGSLVTKSTEYIENVNLFTVSMGEYASEAKTYAERVSEAMGIDTSDWMRAEGVFMTISTGFGIVGDRAYKMSENLTKLGYDISSFYNISVKDAMDKLKSGLAGELEPLRAIGYDLSQAKLEATALALGIDKSVSSMTQAEKAQLRYYAIMTQVTSVQGDMARTLEDPANQMRVFTAQLSMARREIGNLFIPALNAILPYAIAVTKVIRSLANTIASLFGIETHELGDSTGKVVTNTDAIQENLENGTDAAKKLKSYMLGFDELNVINPNTDTGEDVSNEFDFELPEYDFMGELAESKVNVIVEEMKEWLGITEEINSWSDLLDTRLGSILQTVGLIGAGIAAWKIGVGIFPIIQGIWSIISGIGSAISGIQAALPAVGTAIGAISAPVLIAVGVVTALVAGLAAVYATNEDVRESVNNAVADIGQSFVPLFQVITDTIIPDVKAAWKGLLKMLKPFGEWLKMVFTSIWEDMLIPTLEYVADTVIPSMTETLENVWNNVFVPLGEFLASVFTPIVGIVSDVLTLLWKLIIVPLADFIGGIFAKVWEGLVKILNQTVLPIIRTVISVFQFLWDYVLAPIVNFLWTVFSPAFESVFKSIGEIIGDLKLIFGGVIDFIVGVFTLDFEQALKGLGNILVGIMNGVISVVEGVVNGIISLINGLIDGINDIIGEAGDWIGLDLEIPLIPKFSLGRIPAFAEGGFPESGQAFVARENGIPEMVGTIGRRTAVANNEQIVESVASGVAEANGEQNALLREQNSLLRALLEKDSGVYLDGRALNNSVEKYRREQGRVLITGGAL